MAAAAAATMKEMERGDWKKMQVGQGTEELYGEITSIVSRQIIEELLTERRKGRLRHNKRRDRREERRRVPDRMLEPPACHYDSKTPPRRIQ